MHPSPDRRLSDSSVSLFIFVRNGPDTAVAKSRLAKDSTAQLILEVLYGSTRLQPKALLGAPPLADGLAHVC